MAQIADLLENYPEGLSPDEIEKVVGVSRSTLLRMLKAEAADLEPSGQGPSRRYRLRDQTASIKRYFSSPPEKRRVARFQEEILFSESSISFEVPDKPARPLDKYELAKFLIDFACASSALEGGTYSVLDTEVLVTYGQRAKGKPLKDAFLVLNHKEAFEYLFAHLEMSAIFHVHDLLTNDHEIDELKNSEHFLDRPFRGVPREFEDVAITGSSYLPPFRPGTGYIKDALARVLKKAVAIENPVSSAFCLLTRLPYLQPFKDGNKRVARALCNVPLLSNGLPPISFVDFDKADYVLGMKAFYELGNDEVIGRCFSEAYTQSCDRLEKPLAPRFR